MDELEKHHLETLRHVLDKVNQDRKLCRSLEAARQAREAEERRIRKEKDAGIANRPRFE